MATLYLVRVQTGDQTRYYQSAVGEVVSLPADDNTALMVIPVAKGWKEIDQATYAAGMLTCTGTKEITPTAPTPTPTPVGGSFSLLAYKWDGGAGNYSFTGYALADDGVALEAYMQPLDGQAAPTSSFEYLPMATVSDNVSNAAFNRAFYHLPQFQGGVGIAPGRWRLFVRRQGDTVEANRKSIDITLFGGRGSETGISDGYVFVGNLSVIENGSTAVYVQRYVNGAPQAAEGVTIALKNGRTGLSGSSNANSITVNCLPNSVQGDSYTATLEASLNGKVILSAPLQVIDASSGGSTATSQYSYEFFEFVPADRVTELAVTTTALDYSQSQTGNQVDCFVLAKVEGNPTIWTGVYVNNQLSSGTGTDYYNLAQGPPAGKTFPASWSAYQRLSGINTLGNGNSVRIDVRLGSESGPLLLSYPFASGLPMLPLTTRYTPGAVQLGDSPYMAVTQRASGVPGWALNTTRYLSFDNALTNQQAYAQFTAQNLNQQIAQTATNAPSAPAGKVRQARAGSVGGTGQRTPAGNFSGPGQNAQVVSDNAMYSATFNRYDAATNTYFVNYIVGDAPGQGYEWRIFQKDRFYTIDQASQSGLPPFRDNMALLIRVNPNTAQSSWRNQENPNFYSVNLSTRYE